MSWRSVKKHQNNGGNRPLDYEEDYRINIQGDFLITSFYDKISIPLPLRLYCVCAILWRGLREPSSLGGPAQPIYILPSSILSSPFRSYRKKIKSINCLFCFVSKISSISCFSFIYVYVCQCQKINIFKEIYYFLFCQPGIRRIEVVHRRKGGNC